MGSLPRAKAGVGSAINDTTRQVGGALGVAIIGTIVSSVYAAQISAGSGTFGLSTAQLATAESSLGGAQAVAQSLGAQAGSFADVASEAFVDALSIGLRISACVILGALFVAWRFLPARAAGEYIDELVSVSHSESLGELVEQPVPVTSAGQPIPAPNPAVGPTLGPATDPVRSHDPVPTPGS